MSESTKMTDLPHSEERYPLLFLFLDDGQKSSRRGRGVFFERSRTHGIMSGATTVLTQWPGQFTSCGLTMLILLITSLLLSLILLASTIKPVAQPLHPRCIKRSYDYLANTSLYLVHDSEDWQQNQLDALEQIATKYNQCDIELMTFQNENEKANGAPEIKVNFSVTSRFRDLKKRPPYAAQALPRKKRQIIRDGSKHLLKDKLSEEIDLNINIGAKNQLKAFLEHRRSMNSIRTSPITTTTEPPVLTLSDLMAKFPAIKIRNVTKERFFEESPLFSNWKNLNGKAVIFAARVLKLWENGGISFELPETIPVTGNLSQKQLSSRGNSSVPRTLSPVEENKIIKNMIDIGYASFKNLPEGLVTVDEEGVHMETKTTCHAFFGEALQQLHAATNRTTVPEVIRNTLKTFCERGAVDSDYCNSIKA